MDAGSSPELVLQALRAEEEALLAALDLAERQARAVRAQKAKLERWASALEAERRQPR